LVTLDKTKTEETGKTHYRLALATKSGVRPFGPKIPHPALFERSTDFRDFFLTKLINSHRAALDSPVFKEKLVRTRKQLLNQFLKT